MKAITLFGMSGVGKTRVASILNQASNWFHYSVDYRIGTRYLGEEIVDEFRVEAMQNEKLRDLIRSDSIYISSNLSFHNLRPLSNWLGKPGSKEHGGIPFREYCSRQRKHRSAEISATLDIERFIGRAKQVYQSDGFICDTSGSFCEIVQPFDENDVVLSKLSKLSKLIYIKGDDRHRKAFSERFQSNPKPMYYNERFLTDRWKEYTDQFGLLSEDTNPDNFSRYIFDQVLDYRIPAYQDIADNWGITVNASDIEAMDNDSQIVEYFRNLLENKE